MSLAVLLLAATAEAGVIVVGGPGTLAIWESSLGSPGSTADFPIGSGQTAEIDFDASSAEGGGLLGGASEIEIRPFGGVTLSDFSCAIAGCSDIDFFLVPGDEGDGAFLSVSDPRFTDLSGLQDLGSVLFDASGPGGLQLTGCNYIGLDFEEHSCAPFTLVQVVPEPGSGTLLCLGIALLTRAGRRRRA